MPDSLMYEEQYFVLLQADRPEEILSVDELLERLRQTLANPDQELPKAVQALPSIKAQADYLLEHFCELDLGPGQFFQWYAIRLEK